MVLVWFIFPLRMRLQLEIPDRVSLTLYWKVMSVVETFVAFCGLMRLIVGGSVSGNIVRFLVLEVLVLFAVSVHWMLQLCCPFGRVRVKFCSWFWGMLLLVWLCCWLRMRVQLFMGEAALVML